jgi:hypothetical protein
MGNVATLPLKTNNGRDDYVAYLWHRVAWHVWMRQLNVEVPSGRRTHRPYSIHSPPLPYTCPCPILHRGTPLLRFGLTGIQRLINLYIYITFDNETMSTITHEAASTTDEPLANLLFDFTGADIILRSRDSYHYRVPKTYLFNSSPVLGELIQRTSDSANPASLPVVQLPDGSEIILCLLTFIFPVTPLLPSTLDKTMELLSVAQNYQVGTALSHMRASISQQNSLPTGLKQALHIYSLAQKYRLRREALQSARTIFLKQSMTIEDFGDKLDTMPGDSLYELWKYHERVRAILAPNLAEFRKSCARGTLTGLRCTELSSSQIPSWLDHYIESVGESPNLFDSAEFNMITARHTKDKAKEVKCECASIPSRTMHDFWEALASVVHGSFELVSAIDNLIYRTA